MLVFANPTFLWALTAAAIPLMLHMFQRRRTVVTPFQTLRFLKAAQKRPSSRVRFENFLLWLLRTLLQARDVLALQKIASDLPIDEQVLDYAVRLARATRTWPGLAIGAGPRASIALVRCGRARALLRGG